MNGEIYTDITKQAVTLALFIASPMLLGALIIGILVSLFQAVTQINEQTLSFIPKILVIVGAIAIWSPWMSEKMVSFTRELILSIPSVVRTL